MHLPRHGGDRIDLQQPGLQRAVHQEVYAQQLKGHAGRVGVLLRGQPQRRLRGGEGEPCRMQPALVRHGGRQQLAL